MKKLLAILLAWFTAFYNNVAYVDPPRDQGYQQGNYFVLETDAVRPDYRENSKVTNSLDSKSVCAMSNYAAKKYDASAESLRIDSSDNSYAYWWQASTDTNSCDVGTVNTSASTISLPQGAVIIAPAACRRTTASDVVQSYPIAMTLEITMGASDYVVTITGMHCWACDAFRELNTVDGVPVIVHTYTESEHFYKQGEVLGIAGSGCQISISKKSGGAATVAEFYGM